MMSTTPIVPKASHAAARREAVAWSEPAARREASARREGVPDGAGGPTPEARRGLRRVALWLPTLALALISASLAVAVVGWPGTMLGAAVLATFALGMAWQGFIAWQYVYGFVVAMLREHGPRRGPCRPFEGALERDAGLLAALPSSMLPSAPVREGGRTAVVVAIHAEDPAAVFAGVRVMAQSLMTESLTTESLARGTGGGDIDLFVLSDTRDPAIAAGEEREFARIREWAAEEGAMPGLRYRRRAVNTGRKAGNIAEFCDTYGDAYEFMIVLDADSLMTGAAMRRLVALMRAHPRVGLIQTVSYAAGRDTLFARLQQFAVRLYAPLGLRCLEAWQGPDGSYWGHNAIVRVAPFREHARLPVLPGRAPLGGEILCHDTVEGALLRRAGWEVRLLPEMAGTWEEMPTNLVDLLGRERRWCQGNLQHLGVLGMPGLAAASRAHLGIGILAYLAAPVWALFFALGTWQAARGGHLGLLAYGLGEPGPAAALLAALAFGLIAAPKVLSLIHVLSSAERRAAFGGAGRLLVGALLEQLAWIALWPVVTVFNAGAVVTTFLGRVVRWDAQARDDRRVPWREALRLQSDALVVGGALTIGLVLARDPALALWMGPVAVALLGSPALSVLTSRVDLGALSRRAGLFLTVDDTRQAEELRELHRRRALAAPAPAASPPRASLGEAPVWLATAVDDAKAAPPR